MRIINELIHIYKLSLFDVKNGGKIKICVETKKQLITML